MILGLSIFGQNPAACLLKEGRILAFAEEERFIRIKGALGYFPIQSIKYCLKEANVNLAEIKKISIAWDYNKYRYRMPIFFIRSWWKYGKNSPANAYSTIIKQIIENQPQLIRQHVKIFLKQIGRYGEIPPIDFVPHHLAHAASAYFSSGFDKARILVMDGSGEEYSTSIFNGEDCVIKEIAHYEIPNSLGWFYAALTAYLGFIPYQEDGFLMGLAAYGKPNESIAKKIDRLIKVKSTGKYNIDPQFLLLGKHNYNEHFSDKLADFLGPPRLANEPIEQKHKDIAYAVQKKLELAIISLVKQATNYGKQRNLCLAGGVALNCKANGLVYYSGLIDKLFVQPVSNDSGSALGAAMLAALEAGYDPRFRMQHVRWGPSYSLKEIEIILKEAHIKYKKPSSIEKVASEFIARGKIIAWFSGRMEVGPRALGGRSILANATARDINLTINEKVKHRDRWRPFSPSLTKEVARNYFLGGDESRYMIVAYPVIKNQRKKISPVVHIDGTIRPQTVDKCIDPKFHQLIKKVGERTGAEVVLNTSLNVKGEPIACNPRDALRCFYSSGLDALAIEEFWLEK